MYNYSGLWIRLIWLGIICLSGGIILFLIRNKLTNSTKIIGSILILGLFTLSCFDCLPSIIQPRIKCIEGIYINYASVSGASPFQYEYCFEVDEKKYYIDMDAFSKKKIYPYDLIVGKKYTVYYEESQNLIISIYEEDK